MSAGGAAIRGHSIRGCERNRQPACGALRAIAQPAIDECFGPQTVGRPIMTRLMPPVRFAAVGTAHAVRASDYEAQRTTAGRPRPGFTLIEPLVVITIIVDPGRAAAPRRPGGPRGGTADSVRQQSQADRPRLAQLPSSGRQLSSGHRCRVFQRRGQNRLGHMERAGHDAPLSRSNAHL